VEAARKLWRRSSPDHVTQPDGSHVDYGYDDAHRLTSVSDSLGNRIDYTLDSAATARRKASRTPAAR
jgi:YD repeat-containing protein